MAKPKKLKYTKFVKNDVNEYNYSFSWVNYYNNKITEINPLSVYKSICRKEDLSSIKDYCLDRFIRKSFTEECISLASNCGYYGDETRVEIKNSFFENLNDFIDKLNNPDANESELIETTLMLEYGYILPELKNKKWEFLSDVDFDKINPAAGMKHVDKLIVDKYKKETSENGYNITCLCANQSPWFRLIDGYHRYSAAHQLKFNTVDCVICK